LLKDFYITDETGEVDDLVLGKMFKKKWFYDVMNYALDANYFGYSLINLGNVVKDEFEQVELVRRHNISPDRLQVTSYVYSLFGVNFTDPEFVDWALWVPTNNEIGVGKCGHGLLYKIAPYEIFIRNNMSQNATYTEMFAQPYRVGKTSKTGEAERALLEEALRNMGSEGYAIIDTMDEINFIETGGGQGYKSYESLEMRCEKKISKLILGHADAMDSIPGKLGSEDTIGKALREIEVSDGRFMEYIINDLLISRMRNIGFNIPENRFFRFKNDKEKEEMRRKEDESNKMTADIVKVLFDAGVKVDLAYINKRTGIPVVEAPAPIAPPINKNITNSAREKLDQLYS
jgi:phage gp29-like protein